MRYESPFSCQPPILAHLLYNFDFELDEEHLIAFEPLVTLKPKYGIKLKIKAN